MIPFRGCGRCAVGAILFSIACFSGVAGQPPAEFDERKRAFYAGNLDEALRLSQEHLKAHPEDWEARVVLARILASLGRTDEALTQFEIVLENDAENVDGLYFLAALTAALSNREFQRLYQLAPDSARVHQLMGESYQIREDLAQAQREFETALVADPGLFEARIALAEIHRTQSRFEEAIPHYQKVLQLDPENFQALYGLGVCYRYSRDHEAAVGYFSRAASADPRSAVAHWAWGASLYALGKPKEAVGRLENAVRLEPRMDQAYYLLGQVYQRLGEREKSREAFERARALKASELQSVRETMKPPNR